MTKSELIAKVADTLKQYAFTVITILEALLASVLKLPREKAWDSFPGNFKKLIWHRPLCRKRLKHPLPVSGIVLATVTAVTPTFCNA